MDVAPLLDDLLIALAVVVGLWLALVAALFAMGRGSLATEVARFIPNALVLVKGLLGDRRVPVRAKLLLGACAVYLASPIDLVPDFIPVIGHLDDAIVLALVLRAVLRWTDRAVIDAHWRGDPATLDRLLRLVRAL